MRISTNQYFTVNTTRMTNQQAQLAKLQSQMSSGQSVMKPSDDPMAMATALGAQAGVKTIDSYQSNLTYMTNQLTQMDDALSSGSDVMQSIKESLLAASNGTLSASDRESLAKDLEGRVDELRGIANRQDSSGNYLFSGTYQDKTPFQAPDPANGVTGAFLETTTPVTAAAITGRSVQVANGRTMDLNITGNDAFVSSKTGRSAFDVLTEAVSYLRDPGFPNAQAGATPTDTFRAAFTADSAELDGIFNDMQLSRTKVGVRLREADTLTTLNTSASAELQRVAGDAVAVDYAKAISELSQGQLQLQASQQSFSSVSKLSLFNYLG